MADNSVNTSLSVISWRPVLVVEEARVPKEPIKHILNGTPTNVANLRGQEM